MIRLGGHGLPVTSDDPYAFARAHTAFGYGAAYCPPVRIETRARLADIRKAFEAEGISIAEIGIWRNLITPDDAVRGRTATMPPSASPSPMRSGRAAR